MCHHVWGEGEDWIFDGETENHIMVYECTKCGQRMTPEVVNEQLTTLQALLKEAAPKCDCGTIATLEVYWHDENHLFCENCWEKNGWKLRELTPLNLGVRIKAALEE